MKEFTCPSCGAPVPFRSAASILAVCAYCSSTLVRHDANLENVGKMAELQEDSSPLQLGAEGRYRGVPFTIVGRIQLRYPQGLWNEWHLLFEDQRSGWLGEAGGVYAVSFLTPVKDRIPGFKDLHPGDVLVLQGQTFEVACLEEAFCIAGRGELSFQVGPGYAAPAVELAGPGNSFAALDYSEEEPLVFLGEYVDFKDLHLFGLREIHGW
jgi:hypothetical protein